jgi:hypothetical protein
MKWKNEGGPIHVLSSGERIKNFGANPFKVVEIVVTSPIALVSKVCTEKG